VAAQAGVPVTVKLRSGLVPGERVAVALAPRLEQAGVEALSVHPRAASEHYRGRADHSVTAAVVKSVDIPVIASGDVTSVDAAVTIVEVTGAAAVMVARGAAGDPWLVRALLSGRSSARPPLAEVVEDLRRLLALAVEEKGPRRAALWMRRLLSCYLRPSGVDPAVIGRLRTLCDAADLDAALRALACGAPV